MGLNHDMESDSYKKPVDDVRSEGDVEGDVEREEEQAGSCSSRAGRSSARPRATGTAPAPTSNGYSFRDYTRCPRCHKSVLKRRITDHMKAHRLDGREGSSIQDMSCRCFSCISSETPCVVARRPNTPGLMTISCKLCLQQGHKCSFQKQFPPLAAREREFHPVLVRAVRAVMQQS